MTDYLEELLDQLEEEEAETAAHWMDALGPVEGSILARRDCLTLDNGMRLRLLSALEVLQARREAEGLARAPKEHALCSNACLLARALETEEGSPIFSGGEAVLAGLRVGEIAALAKIWSQFNREENPALTMGQEEAEALKKN